MEAPPPQMNAVGAKPPPPHTSPKNVWVTKIAFRIASSIFCLVLIGISANSYTQWGSDALIYFIPPAGFSFIWNAVEFICILVRGGRRGMHPAAIVSIDLILWLAYITVTVIFGLISYYDAENYSDYGYSSYYYYGGVDDYSDLSNIINSGRALLAFGVLEVLTHFALFVIGCVETNIRNRFTPAPIVYYAAPPGMQPIPYQPGVVYPAGAPGPHQSIIIPNGAFPAPPGSLVYPAPPQPGQQQPMQQPQWVPAAGVQHPHAGNKDGSYTPSDAPAGTHSSDVHSVRS